MIFLIPPTEFPTYLLGKDNWSDLEILFLGAGFVRLKNLNLKTVCEIIFIFYYLLKMVFKSYTHMFHKQS